MVVKRLEEEFAKFKTENEIFDINCCLTGYMDATLEELPIAPQTYFAEGIDKMVLTSSYCLQAPYRNGNQLVFETAKQDDRFYASATIGPDMCYAGRDFAAALEEMLANKTVIVRMFPKQHKYQLRKWLVGDMLAELERRRVPLMVWHTQADWNDFAEIAEAYPDLPIIIEGSDQKTLYYVNSVMGLVEKFPNIYLEMHNFTQYDFLPYALKYVGADRLLFGSRSPFNDMNCPLYQIFTNADETQRKLILSENMKRLISQIK